MWRFRRDALEQLPLALVAIGLPLAMAPGLSLAFALPKLLILQLGTLALAAAVIWRLRVQARAFTRLPSPPVTDTTGRGDGWTGSGAAEGAAVSAIRPRPRRVAVALLVLWLAWMLLAFSSTLSRGRSWSGAYEWRNGIYTLLTQAGMAVAVAILTSRPRTRAYLFRALVLGSVPVLLYALLQAVALDPIGWDTDFRPVFSTFGNSPLLAGYLALIAPLTLAEGLAARRREVRRALLALVAGQALLVLIAGARGGLLALVCGLAVLLIADRATNLRRLRLAGVLAAAATLAAPVLLWAAGPSVRPALGPLDSLVYPARETVGPRIAVWRVTVPITFERPILGSGSATFDLALYQSEQAAGMELLQTQYWDRAHNLWLELAVESGWPGALLFLAAALAVLNVALGEARAATNRRDRLRALAPAAGIVAGLVDRQFSPGAVGTDAIFWVLIGLALSGGPSALGAGGAGRLNRALLGAGMVAAGVLAAWGLVGTWTSMRADRAYLAGQVAERSGRYAEAVAHYTDAVAREANQPEYVRALARTHLRVAEISGDRAALAQAETYALGALALEPLDVRAVRLVGRLRNRTHPRRSAG